jgi:ArsR family transcriptional regulator, arsenate/arsenite/antimonite-responsive transcriptional repressor
MIKHIDILKDLSKHCQVEGCMEALRALSDETRLNIIALFYNINELCANDIAKNFTLSRPTISHHLNLMKRAKILKSRKEGKEIYFSVNKNFLKELLTSLLENINKCC